MAEDVFDSWEDMIDENGVLDKKLQDMKIVESAREVGSIKTSNACMDSKINSSISSANDSAWPSIRSSDSLNSVKILKRPTNNTPINPTTSDSSMSSTNSSVSQTIQNQTNSVGPQIMLEDNTRTQYVPQVRILKRPNTRNTNESNDKSMSSIDRKSMTGNRSQSNNKTYEEREAEYAKARLRILGSASAQEDTNSSTELCQLSNSTNSSSSGSNILSPTNSGLIKSNTNSANNTPMNTKLVSVNHNNDLSNVPIIRLPQGPDGSKGFNHQRR